MVKFLGYFKCVIVIALMLSFFVVGAIYLDRTTTEKMYSKLEFYNEPLEAGRHLSDSEGIYCCFEGGKLKMDFLIQIQSSTLTQNFECRNKRRALYLLEQVDLSYSFKLVTNYSIKEISRDELIELIEDYNFSSWNFL